MQIIASNWVHRRDIKYRHLFSCICLTNPLFHITQHLCSEQYIVWHNVERGDESGLSNRCCFCSVWLCFSCLLLFKCIAVIHTTLPSGRGRQREEQAHLRDAAVSVSLGTISPALILLFLKFFQSTYLLKLVVTTFVTTWVSTSAFK